MDIRESIAERMTLAGRRNRQDGGDWYSVVMRDAREEVVAAAWLPFGHVEDLAAFAEEKLGIGRDGWETHGILGCGEAGGMRPDQIERVAYVVYDVDRPFSMRGLADTRGHADALAEWLTLLAGREMGVMPVE